MTKFHLFHFAIALIMIMSVIMALKEHRFQKDVLWNQV